MPKYRRTSLPLTTPYALPSTSSLDTDNDAEDDKFGCSIILRVPFSILPRGLALAPPGT